MAPWLALKALHLLAGVYWVGAGVVSAMFLLPSARAAGPAAGPMMRQIVAVRRFPLTVTIMSFVTVITGMGLLAHVTLGFQPEQFRGFHRSALSIGILAALIAFVFGLAVQMPAGLKLTAVTSAIQGAPTPEQLAGMEALQKRLHAAGRLSAWLLIVALLGMAMAHPV